MRKRSILSDEELVQGAQAIADDVRVGGTGRLMLARVIDAHLGWFAKARARGLAWTDIIDILTRAGVTRPDGRPLSRGHLSSLIWRKQKAAAAMSTPVTTPNYEVSRTEPKLHRPPPPSTMTRPDSLKPANPAGSHPAPISMPMTKPAATPNGADTEEKTSDRNKLLTYMRRSARARGGS